MLAKLFRVFVAQEAALNSLPMHAVGIFILCLVATLSAGGLAGAHAEAPTTPVTSGADGSSSGLAAPGSQIWRQDIADVEGAAEGNDSLADALAAGDFNGDGESDLAIGVPLDDVGALEDAGAVNILYGSGSGLTVVGDQIWHQDVPDVEAGAEDFDQFGYALAAGDFNGDGRDDLAIGVPYEDVAIDTIPFVSFDAGAVNVLYGSGGGLSATGDQIWHQEVDGVESAAEVGDHFGYALTAGDFNGDGRDDLAIGVSDEDIELIDDAGAVSIIYGSGSGLTVTGDQIWHQDVDGIEGGAEDGDQFGSALTAGDFDGDGNDDLAIGVPSEAVEVLVAAGAVNVIEGSGSGLTASGGQIWHRDVAGVEGDASSGESFGHALAAGDFNGDGRADVAIGTDSGGRGDVNVLYGSIGGLSLEGDQIWDQDVANVEDIGEINDNFGSALAVGNFNNDAWDDLAIGVRYEDAESIENAGAVNVLHGSGGGLTAAGDQFWNQGVDGVADVPETNDYFGWALASGDFSGDGRDDLAIGVPNEDGTMAEDAGAVQVIYGAAASLPTPTFTGTPTPATAVTPAATHTPMPTTALTPAATHTATPTTAITPAATHTPTPTTASTPTATNAPTSTPTAPVPSPTATNTPITPVVTNTPTAPVPSPTRTRTSTPSLGEVGDADCNGAVNAIDAALILQLVAGLIGTVGCPANADVNSDGAVNAIDAALILQFTAGMLPDL